MRSQTDSEVAYQVPLIAGLVERIHPIEANQKVINEAADGEKWPFRRDRWDEVLG